MYARKKLRGLLALWLVLLLVFGLGTTAYAAATAYELTATGDLLRLSDGQECDGLLYPEDTIAWDSSAGQSGGFAVHFDTGLWDASGTTAGKAYKDSQMTEISYYHSYTVPSDKTQYGLGNIVNDDTDGGPYNDGSGNTVWVIQLNTSLDAVIPAPVPAPEPEPDPEPPAPRFRCDVPVLLDPVGPVEKYGGVGGSITMSVSAGDALRYQWQVNRNDGTGWHNVEGAVSDTYTLTGLDLIHEGWQFRAVVRNNCGPVISPNFTIHVNLPVAEVPATGGPGAALTSIAFGLVSLGVGIGVARKRRG